MNWDNTRLIFRHWAGKIESTNRSSEFQTSGNFPCKSAFQCKWWKLLYVSLVGKLRGFLETKGKGNLNFIIQSSHPVREWFWRWWRYWVLRDSLVVRCETWIDFRITYCTLVFYKNYATHNLMTNIHIQSYELYWRTVLWYLYS